MNKLSRFDAINSKISSMHKNMLSEMDYITLVKKESVPEILTELVNMGFSENIINPSMNQIEAERALGAFRYAEIEKLLHYLDGDYKNFLNRFLSLKDILEVKRILRYLDLGLSDDTISNEVKEKYSINESTTISSFVDSLKPTAFYRVLQSYKDEKSSLFYMEMNLDKLYYSEIISAAEKLSKEDREIVKRVIGKKIDLLNITWIYRGIKYYSLLAEELINFCIFGGEDLNFSKLKVLSYSESTEDFVEMVMKTKYAFVFDGENVDLYMDRRINRYLYYVARAEYNKSLGIGKILGFLFLLDYEVKDLSAIIEASRFNMAPQETLKYLVRSYERDDLI